MSGDAVRSDKKGRPIPAEPSDLRTGGPGSKPSGEGRPVPWRIADTSNPAEVELDLLLLSLGNLWLLVYVNLAVALLIAIVQITVGDPVDRALSAFIASGLASMVGSTILLPVAIAGQGWMAQRPRLARTVLLAAEIAVLSGIGVASLFQASPESYGVNARPMLGLGGGAAITAILAPRLPESVWLGRLVLFLPFAVWLVLVRPDLWWALLAMSAGCYALSVIIATRLYLAALAAADVSAQLRRSHGTTHELAGQLVEALASEREKALRLETEARLRERFLHTITHDLRQSLSAVGLHSRAFARETEDARAQSHADRVVNALQAADEMIESVAQAAWLTAETTSAESRPVALCEVFEALAAEVRPLFDGAGIALEVEPTDLAVEAAPGLLDRVLRNLLHNALRHAGASHVLLAATVANGEIEIAVADDGRGIAPELQRHVFDRFFQGSDPTARPVGSVGLGLAIVKELTERMGGTIRLESRPDAGARFAVRLPRAGTVAKVRAGRGLILDDDRESLAALSRSVEALGGEAVPCASVEEARAAGPVDFYLCDFFLADRVTALDFIETLPESALGRVLVVSAYLPEALAARVRALGCEVAPKPLSPTRLAAFLSRAEAVAAS